MSDLLIIVPTRGRPEAIRRVIDAWNDTGAWADAELRFVADTDDPEFARYEAEFREAPLPDPDRRGPVYLAGADQWRPLVPKLNLAAAAWAPEFFAVGFAGDDHLPRTPGWAGRYLEALRELGTGIVYGDDLLQGEKLPTQWAMTSDIIRTLGVMVPAAVEHLYCDNSVLELGRQAGCIRYLPDVVIEHVHPAAGKAAMDAGYARANSARQYATDRTAYARWQAETLPGQVAAVRALCGSAAHR